MIAFADITMENPDKNVQEPLYRPHLAIAVFCERVLREADGVLSIIRIVDRFMVRGTTPEMGKRTIRFTLLIMFRAGFMRGKTAVTIKPISPTKKELPAIDIPVLFEGDDERGVVLAAETSLDVDEEGLYWFDLSVMGETVTRMPLRIAYQQTAIHGGT